MAENTLLKYFFSSGAEMDPEKRFNLTRKSRVRRMREILGILQHSPFPARVPAGRVPPDARGPRPQLREDRPDAVHALRDPAQGVLRGAGQAADGMRSAALRRDPRRRPRHLRRRAGRDLRRDRPQAARQRLARASAQGASGQRRHRRGEDPASGRQGHDGAGHRHHAHRRAPGFAVHEGQPDARPAGGRRGAVGHLPGGDRLRPRGRQPAGIRRAEQGRGVHRLPQGVSRAVRRVRARDGVRRGHPHLQHRQAHRARLRSRGDRPQGARQLRDTRSSTTASSMPTRIRATCSSAAAR